MTLSIPKGGSNREHKADLTFGAVLPTRQTIDQLSLDEQETLIDILHRRMAEQGRKQLAAEIEAARQEFAEGRCQPETVDDLMKEILP